MRRFCDAASMTQKMKSTDACREQCSGQTRIPIRRAGCTETLEEELSSCATSHGLLRRDALFAELSQLAGLRFTARLQLLLFSS
jgi:hypothetical protein